MSDALNVLQELNSQVAASVERLKLAELRKELSVLQTESQAADFWSDTQRAQETMKHIARLEHRLSPWDKLQKGVEEALQLSELKDESLHVELEAQAKQLQTEYDELKAELRFNKPFDDHGAIVTIFAGAGGTDAQDWTQMLFRMYSRWAEKNGSSISIIEEAPGEEAGLKRIMFSVEGDFAYGKLKAEHGVHRLVRLSPFNADNLRQTSFARVEVTPRIDKPGEVELDEKDLKIDVFRSGGHGGQSVNTTDSAVRVTHMPTNITVTIQNERSQLQNKETALTILRSRLTQLQLEQHVQNLRELKGPSEQAAWGNQIRSYVLHPYKQVKDLRSGYETTDPDKVLDGDLEQLIQAYLDTNN